MIGQILGTRLSPPIIEMISNFQRLNRFSFKMSPPAFLCSPVDTSAALWHWVNLPEYYRAHCASSATWKTIFDGGKLTAIVNCKLVVNVHFNSEK